MATIWKEVLQPGIYEQEVMIPAGATILCAATQNGMPHIWFICEPDAPRIPRKLFMAMTGHEAPKDTSRYLGTGMLLDGAYVYHVFEPTN